jgi:hypothetical protein
MKTQNSFIATIIVILVMIMALLTSFTVNANVYEDRLQTAFDDIINAVSVASREHMVSIYSDPETGMKEGQLDVFKFTIDRNGIDLINAAKAVYEQMNGADIKEIYTLWWNDNDRDFQGYRLYYNPDDAIVVGLGCDHCYTVGFVAPDDKQHRKTYTLEWSTPDDNDSISGRIITTYAPIKVKSTSNALIIAPDYFDKLIEMRTEGWENYQKELEKAQAKLEKAQGKLEKAQEQLSKHQNKPSSFYRSLGGQVVKGKVTDPNGEPLIGALVEPVEQGLGYGTATDFNGKFTLTVPDNVKTLRVSYVGYETQNLPIEPDMAITMKEDEKQRNELSDLFLRAKPRTNPLSESDNNDSNSWMKKLLFYVEKVQQPGDRYLYLSKLYELCKDTEGLDQMDLKIAAKQLESVYKQLKDKKKLKENELIFLESMVDLLHSKIKDIHYWNPD